MHCTTDIDRSHTPRRSGFQLDLAPLVAMRAALADGLASLVERINRDDAEAISAANLLVAQEEATARQIADQFGAIVGGADARASEDLMGVLWQLGATGALSAALDDARGRQVYRDCLDSVPEVIGAMRDRIAATFPNAADLHAHVIECKLREAIAELYSLHDLAAIEGMAVAS